MKACGSDKNNKENRKEKPLMLFISFNKKFGELSELNRLR
jgi:hypothetical protein